MTKSLRISETLALPLDAATRRTAILGQSGSGKSNLAVVLAEEMFGAGIPWVAIDGKGDWWGVRSSRDGKGPGLSVPIFGGLHGDVPLDKGSGIYLGELIARERLTCVIDVTEFEHRQHMFAFLADLGSTLLRKNTQALHLFLEECDDYIPQSAKEGGKLSECLGVWQRVVKRGRFRGLGCTMISQRSAAVNKDTLYQAEAMFALRVTGKGDRDAIAGWVHHHGESKGIVESLATLADGEGWVTSPAWLRNTARVRFRQRRTFDSGATPVLAKGSGARAATLADVDLNAIQAAMSETIERQKADDPKALRAVIATKDKRIAELERELKTERERRPEGKTKTIEKPVLRDSDIAAFDRSLAKIDAQIREFGELVAKLDEPASKMREAARIARTPTPAIAQSTRAGTEQRIMNTIAAARAPRPTNGHSGSSEVGNSGLRRMLIALAQRPQGLTNRQLGLRAGISSQSGTFATYLSRARQQGWIADQGAVRLITQAGIDALGSYEPLPTGVALLNYWLGELGQSGAARILTALANAYPNALSNAEIGEAADISAASGTFATYMSRLRGLELIQGSRGVTKASDELFD